MLADPEIVPGCAGTLADTVTASDCDGPLPQALFAVTDIEPLLVLAVAEIEFVVEVPVHPEGSVHV